MRRRLRTCVVLLVTLGCSASCDRARNDKPAAYQGVVEFDEQNLAFEVGGRVAEVFVVRGQAIEKKGAVAALDNAIEMSVRDARKAELHAAEARLALVRAGARGSDVRSLAAQVEAARAAEALIGRNLARAEELAAQGAAAASQVEDLAGQRDRAAAERRAVEERLRTMRAGARAQEVAAAEAQVAVATEAVAVEEARLVRHAIASPIAGTVIDVLVDPGDVVAAGTPVAVVTDDAHPYVDVFVPEARLASMRVGTSASIRIDASETPVAGRVEDVGRRTEFTPRYLFSERERPNLVIRVRVRAVDPERRLHAGVPAFVTFPGSAR